MSKSILDTVKKGLNLGPSDTTFDVDVIMHINSAFSTLTQLGVGPSTGFRIEDKNAEWTSFIEDDPNLDSVKSYIYMRVRLLFDPPATSFAIESFKEQIKEIEWRLQVYKDPRNPWEPEDDDDL